MHDDVSMFVFLPNNLISNMSLLEENLTAEFVQDLAMTLQPTQVSLKMPALKVSYFKDLLPVLSDLGESPSLCHTIDRFHWKPSGSGPQSPSHFFLIVCGSGCGYLPGWYFFNRANQPLEGGTWERIMLTESVFFLLLISEQQKKRARL